MRRLIEKGVQIITLKMRRIFHSADSRACCVGRCDASISPLPLQPSAFDTDVRINAVH